MRNTSDRSLDDNVRCEGVPTFILLKSIASAVVLQIATCGVSGNQSAAAAEPNALLARVVSGLFGGDTHCNASDFKISGLTGTVEYGYLTVVGTVRNTCSEDAAPELKLSNLQCSTVKAMFLTRTSLGRLAFGTSAHTRRTCSS
jgi:hypothetical protein